MSIPAIALSLITGLVVWGIITGAVVTVVTMLSSGISQSEEPQE